MLKFGIGSQATWWSSHVLSPFRQSVRPYRLIAGQQQEQVVEAYAHAALHAYSLQHLIDVSGNRLRAYNLVREELPVRLAQVVSVLPEAFPETVRCQRSYHFLQDYFEMSFLELIAFPLVSFDPHHSASHACTTWPGEEKSGAFAATVRHIGTRLTGTTDLIAEALLASGELTRSRRAYESLQPVLADLFRRNLAAEVMVGLYLAAVAAATASTANAPAAARKIHARDLNFIHTEHDVRETIDLAYQDARYLCEQHYISAPELEIHGSLEPIACLPSHLYLILFELLKNSLRATVEHYGEGSEYLPPVTVTLNSSGEDVASIRIEDQGGGIAAAELPEVVKFFRSSARLNTMSLYQGAHSSPMAGYGFGLGMAKIFAEYWGGSLQLTSERDKTSAEIRMFRDPALARENIL